VNWLSPVSETTVTGRSVALINMTASFIDQVNISIIDIKILQCINLPSRLRAAAMAATSPQRLRGAARRAS
jgi:hypothetical protein